MSQHKTPNVMQIMDRLIDTQLPIEISFDDETSIKGPVVWHDINFIGILVGSVVHSANKRYIASIRHNVDPDVNTEYLTEH